MLFAGDNGDGDEDEDGQDNKENKGRRTKEEADRIARQRGLKKWNWELLIHNLCKGEIWRYEQILKMNYLVILNHLSMKKELKLE